MAMADDIETPRLSGRMPSLSRRGRFVTFQDESPITPIEQGPLTPNSALSTPTATGNTQALENQIASLQRHVQSLTDLLHSKVSWSSPELSASRELEDLRSENDQLVQTLTESESRLQELQDGVVSLQEEYRAEFAELQEQVKQISEEAEDEHIEKLKLQRDLEKLSRSKESLEAYLNTLPSKEEFQSLKQKFRAREAHCENLELRLREKDLLLKKLQEEHKGSLTKVRALEQDNEELKAKFSEVEHKYEIHNRARLQAKDMNISTKENLLVTNLELSEENEKLKKAVSIWKKKNAQIVSKYEESISSMAKKLDITKEKLESAEKRAGEEEISNRYLREDLTKARGELVEKRNKIEELQNDIEMCVASDNNKKEERDLLRKVLNEMAKCMEEIEELSRTTEQLYNRNDPEVSLLLGTRALSVGGGIYSLQVDAIEKDQISAFHHYLKELKQTRTRISTIRSNLAEKYAENIGDNMTSCITQ